MISVDKLCIRQGRFSLNDISFEIPPHQYAVLMGKTGCGKTSILEAICGLRKLHSGRIVVNGRDVTNLRPSERGIGYVPQDGALFDSMRVRDHLAFALTIRGLDKKKIADRIEWLAELLELSHLLDRYPAGLSGGEKQRVAVGRAISFDSNILLLDEPMSALDETTRQQMYDVFRRVREQTPLTSLHVTHNSSEARELGDLTLRLENGKIISSANLTPVRRSTFRSERLIITVQYTTQLRTSLKIAEETLEFESAITVGEMVSELSRRHGTDFTNFALDGEGQLLPSILVCVDDQQVSSDLTATLTQDCVVTLLSAISGG